eukprot:TRINITY_DN7391_c0_g1_i1.p1 TRINITY_DN7391_c0_g1~~TRINITY_DN7391_c0_g1_i1.p1  ORF type:complete len:481 (+),score=90.02 TRINITY_DN7391_c0_g1_i1:144-1586(+)
MYAFFLMWMGQFVSLLGTDITKFALRVWTYRQTGSVTTFAMLTFFTEIPGILISPYAGAIVDRYSRKKIMIISDTVAAMGALYVSYLINQGQFQSWHIYVANSIAGLTKAFQWPAFEASVVLLVPKKHLARFGGINQVAPALSMLIAPAISGAVLNTIKLEGIIMFEFVTFIVAFVILLITRIPPAPISKQGQEGKGSLHSEALVGFRFITRSRALLALLINLTLTYFTSGMSQVLLTPLMLSMSTASVVGMVVSVSGFGALAGALLLSFWGGPRRKVLGVLICGMFQGFLLAAVGLWENSTTILAIAFVYCLMIPMSRALRDSIWQQKVPADMQGRVFAMKRIMSELSMPLAACSMGPLADHFFEPLLRNAQAPLAQTFVGKLVGVGKGRGIALIFVIFGLANALTCFIGLMYRPLKRIDKELPDAPSAHRLVTREFKEWKVEESNGGSSGSVLIPKASSNENIKHRIGVDHLAKSIPS